VLLPHMARDTSRFATRVRAIAWLSLLALNFFEKRARDVGDRDKLW